MRVEAIMIMLWLFLHFFNSGSSASSNLAVVVSYDRYEEKIVLEKQSFSFPITIYERKPLYDTEF